MREDEAARAWGAGMAAGDLYEVLQISPRATPEVVQAAYRALARAYHPDVSSVADAETRTRRLNAAHFILSDPGRRASYDAIRAEAARSVASRSRAAGSAGARRTPLTVHPHQGDRPHAPVVIAWIATASVALLIMLALLVMLWALFDTLDSPEIPGTAPRLGGRTSLLPAWSPPPGMSPGG